MKLQLLAVLYLVAAVWCADEETATAPTPTETPAVQELGMARVLASKFMLSQYAVEDKEVVVDYRLYNVGDKTATKVSLDDRHSFPTTHFEIVRGLLQVRWERLATGANVSHSVVLKPRYAGSVNYTAAIVQYLPTDDAQEARIGYSTAPGEGYIYRLKDYERKFGSHYTDWAIFALMALPCLALPYLLWCKTKSRYEVTEKKQK